MTRIKLIILIIIFLATLVLGFLFFQSTNNPIEKTIENFDDCVAAGNPVMEIYPGICKTPDGQFFTQDIGNELEKRDLIRIDNPRPNQVVSSPLLIQGEARGNWFFEGDFPVRFLDGNGKIIITNFATAQGEWMTEDFVPFQTEIIFDKPATKKGMIILEKDNPSGLPENDDELRVPIVFE